MKGMLIDFWRSFSVDFKLYLLKTKYLKIPISCPKKIQSSKNISSKLYHKQVFFFLFGDVNT